MSNLNNINNINDIIDVKDELHENDQGCRKRARNLRKKNQDNEMVPTEQGHSFDHMETRIRKKLYPALKPTQ